jgi:hypothetical protein
LIPSALREGTVLQGDTEAQELASRLPAQRIQPDKKDMER